MAELPRCASCRVSIVAGQNVVFRADGRVHHVACPEVLCSVCSDPVQPHDPIRRDGEAIVHGNCWLRRSRAEPMPPAKMLAQSDRLTSIIGAKVLAGTLPRMIVEKVWAGLGKGLPCSACDQSISRSEVEHEVDGPDSSRLRFHRTCMMVWQKDVTAVRREISGGSAPSPWTLLFDLHIARRASRDRAAYDELRAAILAARLWVGATREKSRSAVMTYRAARLNRQRAFA